MQHFTSVEDTACCADLDRHNMQVFAATNALHELAGNHRQALWQASIAVPDKDLLLPNTIAEDTSRRSYWFLACE